MINWDLINQPRTGVICSTEKEYNILMAETEKRKCSWVSGKPMSHDRNVWKGKPIAINVYEGRYISDDLNHYRTTYSFEDIYVPSDVVVTSKGKILFVTFDDNTHVFDFNHPQNLTYNDTGINLNGLTFAHTPKHLQTILDCMEPSINLTI
jgi:hypothetical protein